MFCSNCGCETTEKGHCPHCGQRLYQDPPAGAAFQDNAKPSMKWYYFLVYFYFFFNVVCSLIRAYLLFTGNNWLYDGMDCIKLDFIKYTDIRLVSMTFAVFYIGLAGFNIYVRYSWVKFLKDAWNVFILLSFSGMILDLLYETIVMIFFLRTDYYFYIFAIRIFSLIIFLILNSHYFHKRAYLFVH